MPTTRKPKKARTSRELEIFSDIENLDVMLGGNLFDREESEDSILARRPESASCNASDNEESPHLNTRENRSGNSSDRGQIFTGASSSAQINRISGELNFRISREMDEMMNSVSVQIHRATIDDYIYSLKLLILISVNISSQKFFGVILDCCFQLHSCGRLYVSNVIVQAAKRVQLFS